MRFPRYSDFKYIVHAGQTDGQTGPGAYRRQFDIGPANLSRCPFPSPHSLFLSPPLLSPSVVVGPHSLLPLLSSPFSSLLHYPFSPFLFFPFPLLPLSFEVGPLNTAKGLGSTVSFQRGQGRSPNGNRIWYILALRSDIWR